MKKFVALLITIISLFALTSCAKQERVKIIDIPLTEEDYAFIMQKGNTNLKAEFNTYLNQIKENGEFDNIVNKYVNDTEGKVGVVPKTGGYTNDEETFVVATNMPFGVFEYKGSDGLAYGIDIEIAIGFAEEKNLNLVVAEMDFDAIFPSVSTGYSDIGMAGITVTPQREEEFEFTQAYYNASQKLIVKDSNKMFDNCKIASDVEEILKNLKGEKIGYQNGTMGNWYIAGDEGFGFDGFSNIEGVGNASLQLVVQDVAYGRLFAVVTDELPATVLVKSTNELIGFAKIQKFIDYITQPYYQNLILLGLRNTVMIAVIGLLIGLIIGILIGIIKVAPKYKWYLKALDKVATIYVTIFRGTPIVVQLLMAYYVILPICNIMIDKLLVAIIVFGLNSGAYITEIIRGGINSVDKGQLEASRALGLSYNVSMIKVVIPQAIKNIVPSIGNEFISLIKETSVASFISIMDLYNAFKSIGDSSLEKMIPYLVMSIMYILLIVVISFFVKLIEKLFAKSDRRK